MIMTLLYLFLVLVAIAIVAWGVGALFPELNRPARVVAAVVAALVVLVFVARMLGVA
jgi:hypothetical protein